MHVEQEQQYITETISGFALLPQHCSLLIKNIIIVITFYRAMCSTLSEQHQGIGEAPNISGHMMKQKNGHHIFPVCVFFISKAVAGLTQNLRACPLPAPTISKTLYGAFRGNLS
jgi:hypothetical protein